MARRREPPGGDPIGIWTDSNDLFNGTVPSGLCGDQNDEGCGWNPLCQARSFGKGVDKGAFETASAADADNAQRVEENLHGGLGEGS